MNVVISGMGHCSALGQGLDHLRRAVLDGARPEVQTETVTTSGGPVEVPVLRVPEIALPKLVPEAVERRMSRFSKICMATLAEALGDAQVNPTDDSQRIGLVIGTAFGNLDFANNYQKRILQDGPAGASPSLFAASIHNSMAAQLSLAFGIRGPNSTVATMEQTAIGSMRLAYDWIQQDLVDRVAVVVGDELSYFHMYYLAHRQCPAPAGEGAHAFVLEREDMARKKYARLKAPLLASPKSDLGGKVFSAALDGTHSHLYGRMPVGAAFEMGLAALTVERTGEAVTCVQPCNGLLDQRVDFAAE